MNIKKLFIGGFISFILPVLAYAVTDFTILNNTDSYGTGRFEADFCPCSAVAGGSGIAAPHGSIVVPGPLMFMYCHPGKPCYAKLYVNTSCSGDPIARVQMDKDAGFVNIENLNSDYVVSGSGSTIKIDPASGKILNWFKAIF